MAQDQFVPLPMAVEQAMWAQILTKLDGVNPNDLDALWRVISQEVAKVNAIRALLREGPKQNLIRLTEDGHIQINTRR